MEKKNKKKVGVGSIALIMILIAANLAEQDSEVLPVVVVILVFIAIFAAVFSIMRRVKKTVPGRSTQPVHNHDRLQPGKTAPCADIGEHWKKQLDGFLAAGIIDRAEYRVLMQRWARQSSEK